MNAKTKTTDIQEHASEAPEKLEILYGAEAVPNLHGPGYLARYRAPGLVPGNVCNQETKRPEIFPTEDAAIAAGALRLFEILNTPRLRTINHNGKSERYQKLTKQELAILVSEARITWKLLAYLYGTSDRRLNEWMTGRNAKGQEELAPHPLRVLLNLFKADPRNIDIAEAVTDEVTSLYSEKR